jgi:hypothetical protein
MFYYPDGNCVVLLLFVVDSDVDAVASISIKSMQMCGY